MKLLRSLAYASVLLAILVQPGAAQTTAGVAGTITDDSGAVISGVTLTITNAQTGFQRETTSDELGFYQLLLLQPGTYNLTAQKTGFRQATREGRPGHAHRAARSRGTLHLAHAEPTG